MTDKHKIIDETKINLNDFLEPYKPIPACEIKDCDHLVYVGNDVYGCRIAEDGLVCNDFNNDDECCMYRQLEYYKEALKNKEQECETLEKALKLQKGFLEHTEKECERWQAELADKASELQSIEEKIKPLMKRPDDLDCYNLEWIVVAFVDEFNQLKKRNNQLVEQNFELAQKYTNLEEQLNQLKVEDEKLKKTIDDLLHKPEIQDKILWKIDNEALLGSKDAWIYKLEKTLAEIKEIVKNEMEQDVNTRIILQKINECEVEDE